MIRKLAVEFLGTAILVYVACGVATLMFGFKFAGASDQLDTVANDRTLARTIRGATLVLYPDAGHAFLFQDWTRFAALVNSFLAGNPNP